MASPDKRQALESRPADFENRLFFAARNLAIEAMLLRIETRMLRAGFDVTAEWKESSRGNPSVLLKLKNPKPTATSWEVAEATVWLTRDRIQVLERHKISDCFYGVDSVHPTEHWPWRESKLVADFRERVRQLGAEGYFAGEVVKVNYPFDYAPHSSF